jgi:hypothetical protein
LEDAVKRMRQSLGVIIAGVFMVACSGAPAGPSASPVAAIDKPSVSIAAPGDGAQLPLGQDVAVSGVANDPAGVDHVELFVDGVSFGTSPAGQAAPVLQFSVNWLAAPAGQHALQIVAYRADGTASDPVAVNVTVGEGGTASPSGMPSGEPSAGTGSTPPPTLAGAPTPTPTRPRPTPTLTATPTPTVTPTTTPSPTPTASPTPSPTPAPGLTPLPDGTAPDDSASEPHLITLQPCAGIFCRNGDLARGSITEQISAPTGDPSDELYFVPLPNAHYQLQMTTCNSTGGTVAWQIEGGDASLMPGCGDSLYEFTSAAPNNIMIKVFFSGGSGIIKIACISKLPCYSLYTYTIYQLAQ